MRPNHVVQQLIEQFKLVTRNKKYRFTLDVDVRKKTQEKPLQRTAEKTVYAAEWLIDVIGPPIVLVEIHSAKPMFSFSGMDSHPNVVEMYGLVDRHRSDSSVSVMLVQQAANQHDLRNFILTRSRFPHEGVLCEIFRQIAVGMIFLIENGIIHGDLACRNILVYRFNEYEPRQNLVKINKFGFKRSLSVRYAAPEIQLCNSRDLYSEESDVYSMGVLMWQVYSKGAEPWSYIVDDTQVRQQVIDGKQLAKPDTCDAAMWSIISKCMFSSAEHRPTFRGLQYSLESRRQTNLLVMKAEDIPNTLRDASIDLSGQNDDTANGYIAPCRVYIKSDIGYFSSSGIDIESRRTCYGTKRKHPSL
ncbi:unnamed protein product [Didymodactylos carnosus]|uniref:Protein kinase domain-containing protein n=1 Tax=Didymodactylos carnosus TaxID=1234261 RepID=A0A815S966_9BILA|nr:unnamed protein product [Didymodactylos carnosus]CAF4350596.1 unnamed protein product [Didymodactylos carnosus]